MASTIGVKSCELLVKPCTVSGVMPSALSDSVRLFLPPLPKASVECTIAHFFSLSVLTP